MTRAMERMAHGYTNRTIGVGDLVVKAYEGPDADRRRARERESLTALRGRGVPVPEVVGDGADGHLMTRRVPGTHGQELIAAGEAERFLAACGRVLTRIHAPDGPAPGVLVHGDFGPNNVLVDPDAFEVTAVVDWEFAHRGDPVEDLAWCEWIVRTHHADDVPALAAFFAAYEEGGGTVPPWPERKAAMLRRSREVLEWCRRWDGPGGGIRSASWVERVAAVETW